MSMGNEWNRKLMNIEVPQVDIKEQVMNELMNKHSHNTVTWYRKPQILITSIIAIALLSGFITTSIIGIHNNEGKLIFSLRNFDEEQQAPLLQESLINEHLEAIEPGEAIAIYSPVNNPQQIVSAQEKPVIYEQLEALLANVPQDQFYWPMLDTSYYQFKQGVIHHELGHPDQERLITESVQNGGKTVVEKIPVLEQIYGFTMFLEVANQEYIVSIMDGSSRHTLYTDLNQVTANETIATGNGDALLIEREDGQQLLWKSDNNQLDLFYQISVKGKSAAEADQMVALLQALIQ